MEPHQAAPHHLPGFITAPGETDALAVFVGVFLVCMLLLAGSFYFRLHALPERKAHGANRVQLEVVAILALISLFTHNHLFWIAALLLAFIRFPDFTTPMTSIARSLETLASARYRQEPTTEVAPGEPTPLPHSEPPTAPERIPVHLQEAKG